MKYEKNTIKFNNKLEKICLFVNMYIQYTKARVA